VCSSVHDRPLRRILREIDRIHDRLHLGRNGNRLLVGIYRGGGERIGAVGPDAAVIAVTVPGVILRAGVDARYSDANIETAAVSGEAAVHLCRYVDRRQQFVLHDKLGVVGAIGLLLVCRLIAQRELQSVVGGLEAGILQGALETGGVAPQQIVCVGTLDGQARGDVAVAVDVEPNVDTTELGRIKPNLEPVLPR